MSRTAVGNGERSFILLPSIFKTLLASNLLSHPTSYGVHSWLFLLVSTTTPLPFQLPSRRVCLSYSGGAGNFLRSPSRDKKLGIDESIIPGIERGRTASPAGVNKVGFELGMGMGWQGSGLVEMGPYLAKRPAAHHTSRGLPGNRSPLHPHADIPFPPHHHQITHAGRGGSGNIRSPSTDPAARIRAEQEENLEDRLIHERRGRELATDAPFSTGRGGAGNIGGSTSRSRSRSAMGRTDSRQSVATGTTAATAIPNLGHELGRSSSPRHVHVSIVCVCARARAASGLWEWLTRTTSTG